VTEPAGGTTPPGRWTTDVGIHQERRARQERNWHYRHISEDVLPALREHGVPDEQIRTMLVDNPRRYFA